MVYGSDEHRANLELGAISMTMEQRPTLTPEEIAMLNGHAGTFAVADSILSDLEAIGVNVDSHRQMLDQAEAMRAGLLQRFTATQYVAPKPTRGKR